MSIWGTAMSLNRSYSSGAERFNFLRYQYQLFHRISTSGFYKHHQDKKCKLWMPRKVSKPTKWGVSCLKGIVPQKKFYRPNLIFWKIMGCGKAHFGQKGQKTPKIENLGLKVCSLGSRGDPHIRARGNPQKDMLMPLELLSRAASSLCNMSFGR